MLQKSNTPPRLTCSATLAVDNAHQDSLTYWEFSLGRGLLPSTKMKNFKEFYMQKKIIALAVVAAAISVPAFADSSFYGILDGAIVNMSHTGQKSNTLAVSGGLATSRFGLNASEDLGGGMKAIVNLEYALDGQSNTGIGTVNTATNSGTIARQQLLGLTGDFGTVATGYLQTAGNDFGKKFDPTAGSAVSPLQNATKGAGLLIGTVAGATRAQRALAYISPNMSGLTVALNYSTALSGLGDVGLSNNATTTAASTCGAGYVLSANVCIPTAGGTVVAATPGATKGVSTVNTTATLLSATYDAGPLSVGGVYASTSAPDSTTNKKEYALGGSYDLGMAKLFATYQSMHVDAAAAPASNNVKVYSLSGVMPVGPGAVALTYAHAADATNTAGDKDGSGYTGAYLYSMSKTATVYVAYSHMNSNKSGAFSVDNSALGGGDTINSASSNLFALGLSKKF
jgi:predicted porin